MDAQSILSTPVITPATDNPAASQDTEPYFPPAIDSTMVTSFRSCRRKFLYEHCYNFAPYSRSVHLHAGGALAKVLEVFRKCYYTHSMDMEESVFRAGKAFLEFWGNYQPIEIKTGKPHVKNIWNIWGAFEDYLRVYPPDEEVYRPHFQATGEAAIECTFAIPLPVNHPITGDPLLYAGRYDMRGDNGTLWIVDEKTATSLSKHWSWQWHIRNQFMGYTWADRQFGYRTEGAIVRGIAIQQSQYQHREAIIPFTKVILKRFEDQLIRTAKQMVECWEKQHYDYDFGDSCFRWGPCTFLPTCEAVEQTGTYINYKYRHWDPLHQDPTHANAPSEEIPTYEHPDV